MNKVVRNLNDTDLSYVWFDFHGECKNMKWENLSKLVDICKNELSNYGNFIAEINHGFDNRMEFNQPSNFKIIGSQNGAFRTNCMDCLDRTNVVQGVFSRLVAHQQLE